MDDTQNPRAEGIARSCSTCTHKSLPFSEMPCHACRRNGWADWEPDTSAPIPVAQVVELTADQAAAVDDTAGLPQRRHTDEKPTNPKDGIGAMKVPLHLVSGIVKAYQAIAHFLGNVKYGAWNFRACGARASVYKAALDRHIDRWWDGEEYDPVDGTPHLANALACINIILEAKHSGNLIDDRPPSRGGELAKVYAEFEALMPKIVERYKDKGPRHYTIEDTNLQVRA